MDAPNGYYSFNPALYGVFPEKKEGSSNAAFNPFAQQLASSPAYDNYTQQNQASVAGLPVNDSSKNSESNPNYQFLSFFENAVTSTPYLKSEANTPNPQISVSKKRFELFTASKPLMERAKKILQESKETPDAFVSSKGYLAVLAFQVNKIVHLFVKRRALADELKKLKELKEEMEDSLQNLKNEISPANKNNKKVIFEDDQIALIKKIYSSTKAILKIKRIENLKTILLVTGTIIAGSSFLKTLILTSKLSFCAKVVVISVSVVFSKCLLACTSDSKAINKAYDLNSLLKDYSTLNEEFLRTTHLSS